MFKLTVEAETFDQLLTEFSKVVSHLSMPALTPEHEPSKLSPLEPEEKPVNKLPEPEPIKIEESNVEPIKRRGRPPKAAAAEVIEAGDHEWPSGNGKAAVAEPKHPTRDDLIKALDVYSSTRGGQTAAPSSLRWPLKNRRSICSSFPSTGRVHASSRT